MKDITQLVIAERMNNNIQRVIQWYMLDFNCSPIQGNSKYSLGFMAVEQAKRQSCVWYKNKMASIDCPIS